MCFYGFDDSDEDEDGLVPSPRFTSREVKADPIGTAEHARTTVTRARERFVVHLDVDVLDFLALPAADVPQYGRGLTPPTLLASLATRAVARPVLDPRVEMWVARGHAGGQGRGTGRAPS